MLPDRPRTLLPGLQSPQLQFMVITTNLATSSPTERKAQDFPCFATGSSERLRKALRAARGHCYPLADLVWGSTLRSGFVFL